MTISSNNLPSSMQPTSNMATAINTTEVEDKDKGDKNKTYVSRENLMKQVELLQTDNSKLVNFLGKNNEDVVLTSKPVRGVIGIRYLDTGFFRFEMFCFEHRIDNEKRDREVFMWLEDELLHYCLVCDLMNTSYEDLKNHLIEKFGRKYERRDFREKLQVKGERVGEFLNSMYQMGMKVGEDYESILLTIKSNLNSLFKNNLQVQLCKNSRLNRNM